MNIAEAELFFYRVMLCVSLIACFLDLATGNDARYSAALSFLSMNAIRIVKIEMDRDDDDEAEA